MGHPVKRHEGHNRDATVVNIHRTALMGHNKIQWVVTCEVAEGLRSADSVTRAGRCQPKASDFGNPLAEVGVGGIAKGGLSNRQSSRSRVECRIVNI